MNIDREFFLKDFYCIYYLYDKNTIVYIGKTKRPADRLMQHAKSEKVFDSISIQYCHKDELEKTETRLIRKYKPKYNKAGK